MSISNMTLFKFDTSNTVELVPVRFPNPHPKDDKTHASRCLANPFGGPAIHALYDKNYVQKSRSSFRAIRYGRREAVSEVE